MTDSTRARGRGMPRSPSTFMHSGNDVRSRGLVEILPVDFPKPETPVDFR
jgi:hypothetical protein